MRSVRIYQVEADVGHYQSLLPVHFDIYLKQHPVGMRFDGSMISPSIWQSPTVYSESPELLAGDFWGYGAMSNALAVHPRALGVPAVRDLLSRCGQMLPLPYRGEPFELLNVTNVADALDVERSTWLMGRTGNRILPTTYVFRIEALPHAPLFKLPNEAGGNVYIWATEGILPEEEGFKSVVERLGLTGLFFKEVWSEEVEEGI